MGRSLPGYHIALVDADGKLADEGEVCIDMARRPLGLMAGYQDSAEKNAEAMRGGYDHPGDVAARDADGYITFVGRGDDVFKASDYRISPFELESALIEHEAVVEVAVVPSPDPVRLAVPKAYLILAAGAVAGPALAGDLRLLAPSACAVQARAPNRVRDRTAEDRLRQDSAGAVARAGSRAACGKPSRGWRVLRGRLSSVRGFGRRLTHDPSTAQLRGLRGQSTSRCEPTVVPKDG